MDIYSPRGTKVRFTGKGGWNAENKRANEILEVGSVYTIDATDVGRSFTYVTLQEVGKETFNSVLFENV